MSRGSFQVVSYPCPDHPAGDTSEAKLREVVGCPYCKGENETPGLVTTFLEVGSPELEAYRTDSKAWIALRQAADVEKYHSTDSGPGGSQ